MEPYIKDDVSDITYKSELPPAIASIGKDRNNINSILSNIVNFIEKFKRR